MEKVKKLTTREKKFVEEYIGTSKKRNSAITAGYSEKAAHSMATKLLNDSRYSHVQDEISRRKDEIFDTLSQDTARTIKHIDGFIAFDIRQLFDDDNQLKPMSEWTLEQGKGVQSIRILRESYYAPKNVKCPHCNKMVVNEDKEITVKQVVTEVKLVDKRDPLRLMATHQGLIIDKHEYKHTVEDLSKRIRESKARALEAKHKEDDKEVQDAEFQVMPNAQPAGLAQTEKPVQKQKSDNNGIDVF